MLVNNGADLFQFRHKVSFVVQSSGSINYQYVVTLSLSFLQCLKDYCARISTFGKSNDVHAGTLGPDLKLRFGRGPERISRRHQHLVALDPQAIAELADARGLSGTVNTNHKDD